MKSWADAISVELHNLSMSMTRRHRVVEAYRNTVVEKDDIKDVGKDIVETIRDLIEKKKSAVRRIAKKAEELVLKKTATVSTESTYDYYDSNRLEVTRLNESQLYELHQVREEDIFQWRCKETDDEGRKMLEAQHVDRKCLKDTPYIERRENFHRALPLVYVDHFKDEVNLNYSVVKVVSNVYNRGKCEGSTSASDS